MKFIKLREGTLIVNPNEIVAIEKSGDCSNVTLSHGGTFAVRGEDARLIERMVEEAPLQEITISSEPFDKFAKKKLRSTERI